jgi:hypothetical protein
LWNFFRTHIKDFAPICEPLSKATRKDSEYSKEKIIGKAVEVFSFLKTMHFTEPNMLRNEVILPQVGSWPF